MCNANRIKSPARTLGRRLRICWWGGAIIRRIHVGLWWESKIGCRDLVGGSGYRRNSTTIVVIRDLLLGMGGQILQEKARLWKEDRLMWWESYRICHLWNKVVGGGNTGAELLLLLRLWIVSKILVLEGGINHVGREGRPNVRDVVLKSRECKCGLRI